MSHPKTAHRTQTRTKTGVHFPGPKIGPRRRKNVWVVTGKRAQFLNHSMLSVSVLGKFLCAPGDLRMAVVQLECCTNYSGQEGVGFEYGRDSLQLVQAAGTLARGILNIDQAVSDIGSWLDGILNTSISEARPSITCSAKTLGEYTRRTRRKH